MESVRLPTGTMRPRFVGALITSALEGGVHAATREEEDPCSISTSSQGAGARTWRIFEHGSRRSPSTHPLWACPAFAGPGSIRPSERRSRLGASRSRPSVEDRGGASSPLGDNPSRGMIADSLAAELFVLMGACGPLLVEAKPLGRKAKAVSSPRIRSGASAPPLSPAAIRYWTPNVGVVLEPAAEAHSSRVRPEVQEPFHLLRFADGYNSKRQKSVY